MDSESDDIIPALWLGGKGLKINHIITLKQKGGLLNFWIWL
jgi:hypothetical protein